MIKSICALVFFTALSGCATTSTGENIEIKKELSQNNTLVGKNNEDIPVAIPFRAGDDTPRPTVIISHGSGGATLIEYRQAGNAYKWGFNGVVVDHYTPKKIAVHTGRLIQGASAKNRADDLRHVIKWVQQQPWHKGKIALIGLSQGASGIWYLAGQEENLGIAGGAVLYPACDPRLAAPPRNPLFPVQLHIGGSDDLSLPALCETYGDSRYQKHIYDGATHAFNIPARIPGNKFTHRYDQDASRLSQERIKEFLTKVLND